MFSLKIVFFSCLLYITVYSCSSNYNCTYMNDCTVGVCDTTISECVYNPLEKGTPCDDGSSCTKNNFCDSNGECVIGENACISDNVCKINFVKVFL